MNAPGPYPLDYEYEASGKITVRTAQGTHYASTYDPSAARLITAGPDLLEALQNLENDDDSIPAHAWKMCQDAISKAIGQQSS